MAGREYPLERTRNIGIMAHIDAGILQPQQQQEGCNANHKAQRRMNCSKLIAAHSGGNAESNAVKENDMPEE